MSSSHKRLSWPLSTDTLAKVLEGMADGNVTSMPTLQAAVMEIMTSVDGSLTVREIAEELNSAYDRFPTRAAVLKVHARRRRLADDI